MEIEELKWEQNEFGIEKKQEQEEGVQVSSSKSTNQVTNGKIETNGHPQFSPKNVNGAKRFDLDEGDERFEVQISGSFSGVEVEEGTKQEEELVQRLVVSNNVAEKSDLGVEQENFEEQFSDTFNGVEVGEGTTQKEELVQRLVVSNSVVEKSDLGVEQEMFDEQISGSFNGVEVEERTKPEEELAQKLVASNNGGEKSDLGVEQEMFDELISGSFNGVEVEERTKLEEELAQKLVASNNGVEKSDLGVEQEKFEEQIAYSFNGVEAKEGTELKEESFDLSDEQERSEDHVLVKNGVVEEGAEQKEEFHEIVAAVKSGAEEGTEVKEESKHQIGTSTNGAEDGIVAAKGPSKSGHSVYYDKDEGIWKCRICTWTLQGKVVGIGQPKIPRGHLYKMMNYSMLDQRGPLISFGHEGSNFSFKASIKEQIVRNPGDGGVQESTTPGIQLNGHLKSDNLSVSNVQPSKYLYEDHSKVQNSSANDETESADIDLINDSETDVKDYDVENVLQKQNTHDLYCPNCNSCITRRVILRKRKRKPQISGEDIKRNKLEAVVDSKVDTTRARATSEQVHVGADSSLHGTPPLAAEDYHPDQEPEIFRCLSCFSFFIPTGSGFKLFQIFGDKGDKANLKGEQRPTTSKNWFSSIFASDKGKASIEQGSSSGPNAVKSDARVPKWSDNFEGQITQPLLIKEPAQPAFHSGEITEEAGGSTSGSVNQDTKMKGKMTNDIEGKSENGTKSQEGGSVFDLFGEETSFLPNASSSSKEVQGNDGNGELLRDAGRFQVSNGNLAQDSLPVSQQPGLNLVITSTKEESLTIGKSEIDLKSAVAILNKGSDNEPLLSSATTASALSGLEGNGKPKNLTEVPQDYEHNIQAVLPSESLAVNNDNNFQLSSKDGVHPYEVSQHTVTKTKLEIHSNQPLKVDEDALISSVKDALSIQDKPVNITNISVAAAASSIAGEDTVITVEAGHETTATGLVNQDNQIHLTERQGTDAAEGFRIEVIKSIIFGGLAESVTSLSVVSSAAGGDAATLNILALAMANLIGGLFVIFHNLWGLRKDSYEQASNQIMEKQVDRYRELLGRRENFALHAVVAVLSYIIFGLVPPVVYGFSFRKSDDKELKLVAVAAASLACILMLAIGKAYVQRAPKPYFKTISTYIILGFTASGVSYAAGILFKRLLVKLGIFQPDSTVNMLLPQIPGTGATWASL